MTVGFSISGLVCVVVLRAASEVATGTAALPLVLDNAVNLWAARVHHALSVGRQVGYLPVRRGAERPELPVLIINRDAIRVDDVVLILERRARPLVAGNVEAVPLARVLLQLCAIISLRLLDSRVRQVLVVRHHVVAEVLTLLVLRHLVFLALEALLVQTVDVVERRKLASGDLSVRVVLALERILHLVVSEYRDLGIFFGVEMIEALESVRRLWRGQGRRWIVDPMFVEELCADLAVMRAEQALTQPSRSIDLSMGERSSRLADMAPRAREPFFILIEFLSVLPIHVVLGRLGGATSAYAFFCANDIAVSWLVEARVRCLEQQSAGRRQRRRPELQSQVRLALLVIGALKGLKALGRVPANLVA